MNLSQARICIEKIHPTTIPVLKQNKGPLRAAFYTSFLWDKNSTISIGFLDTNPSIPRTSYSDIVNNAERNNLQVDPLQAVIDQYSIIDGIKKIVNDRWGQLTDLKLEFTDPSSANIRISFDPTGGSWSLIGKDCLNQKTGATLNFGWFDVATTLHEFGHVMGMIHEHQNPYGNPIQWDTNKVYEWAKETQGWDKATTDTNILNKYDQDQINGSVFDPQSIMLYFFPASLTLDNNGTQQNLRLSANDVIYVDKMYPDGTLTPSDFYEKMYNESISQALQAAGNMANINIGRLALIGIVIIMIVIGLYVLIKFKMNKG